MNDESSKEPTKKSLVEFLCSDPVVAVRNLSGIIGSTLATIAILVGFTIAVILPNIENVAVISVLVLHFADIAWTVYRWRKKRSFLDSSVVQLGFMINLALSAFQAFFNIGRDNTLIHVVGIIWIVVAFCWCMLSYLSAFERDLAQDRRDFDLVTDTDLVKRDSEIWKALSSHINLLKQLADNQRNCAQLQNAILEGDKARAELFETQRKEIAEQIAILAANMPKKKRKTKGEPETIPTTAIEIPKVE